MNKLLASAPLLAALAAQAHPGHGLPGASHWHGPDAWVWLAAAVVAGAAWWLRRK